MKERLPSYTPLREPVVVGFQYRRRCHKCGEMRPMTGGRTFGGGRKWHCAGCRRPAL